MLLYHFRLLNCITQGVIPFIFKESAVGIEGDSIKLCFRGLFR